MKINLSRALLYRSTLGGKAKLSEFVAILFGKEWWPFAAEPGNDEHPGGDGTPVDPGTIPTPDPVIVPAALDELQADEVWSYFAPCRRYELPEEQLSQILARFAAVCISPWSQRRSETDTQEELSRRMAEIAAATPGRPIHLGLDWFEAQQPGYAGAPADPATWARLALEAMRPYWDRVRVVEVCDEPDDPATLQTALDAYDALRRELGLSPRPTSVTLCTSPSKFRGVRRLDILAVEAYSASPGEDSWVSAEVAKGKILLALEHAVGEVEAAGFRPAVVLQGYARNYSDNPAWGLHNARVFGAQLQAGCEWVLQNRKRLSFVGIFSAGRPSGFCSTGEPREDGAAFNVWSVAWPILEAFSARMRGRQDWPWPALPRDPVPGQPVALEVRLKSAIGQNADAGGVNPPRRWGVVVLHAVAVDALGRRWAGIWESRRRNRIVRWDARASDGSTSHGDSLAHTSSVAPSWEVSLQHVLETLGWGCALSLRSPGALQPNRDRRPDRTAPPAGTSFDVEASCTWGKQRVSGRASVPALDPAGRLSHGLCSAGCGKQRVKGVEIIDEVERPTLFTYRGLGACPACLPNLPEDQA
jgi:hypothetical protein